MWSRADGARLRERGRDGDDGALRVECPQLRTRGQIRRHGRRGGRGLFGARQRKIGGVDLGLFPWRDVVPWRHGTFRLRYQSCTRDCSRVQGV